jgi:hypothetical protein
VVAVRSQLARFAQRMMAALMCLCWALTCVLPLAGGTAAAANNTNHPNPLCTSLPGRPTFHLVGELQLHSNFTTHTNDINAIFWYKGLYHAMFQGAQAVSLRLVGPLVCRYPLPASL